MICPSGRNEPLSHFHLPDLEDFYSHSTSNYALRINGRNFIFGYARNREFDPALYTLEWNIHFCLQ